MLPQIHVILLRERKSNLCDNIRRQKNLKIYYISVHDSRDTGELLRWKERPILDPVCLYGYEGNIASCLSCGQFHFQLVLRASLAILPAPVCEAMRARRQRGREIGPRLPKDCHKEGEKLLRLLNKLQRHSNKDKTRTKSQSLRNAHAVEFLK